METGERAMPGESEVMENHLARYEFAKNFVKDKTVCSIACGSGYGEYMLAVEGGAKEVLGIDYSQEAINYANRHYRAPNLKFNRGNALDSKLKNDSMDVVISLETIEHLPNDTRFLQELKRVLKPGGLLVLSTPNKASSWRNLLGRKSPNPFHLREYRKNQFEKLIESYFTDVRLFGQKVILKRSILLLPKYIVYKFTGKLKTLEKNNVEVAPYPKKNNLETCFFVAVCRKSS